MKVEDQNEHMDYYVYGDENEEEEDSSNSELEIQVKMGN